MVPLTLGALLATGWLLLPASDHPGSALLRVATWRPSALSAVVGSFGGVG